MSTDSDPVGRSERRTLLLTMTFVTLAGMCAAWAWAHAASTYRRRPYPFDTFLFVPDDRFNDLLNFTVPLQQGDPYSTGLAVYPPAAYLAMEPFLAVGRVAAPLLWLAVVGSAMALFMHGQLGFVSRYERLFAALTLTLLTYPLAFGFDRLNIEGFVTVLLCCAVAALQRGRSTAAAVLIGAAAAIKGFPALVALVFLARRDFRSPAVAAASAAGFTFLGSSYYNFDLLHTLSLFRERLAGFDATYVRSDAGLPFGHSLFGVAKVVFLKLGGDRDHIAAAADVWLVLSVVAILALAWLLVKYRPPMWQAVSLAVLTMLLLPTVSFDYRLMNLVIPVALFLRCGPGGREGKVLMALWASLLVPKAYVVIHGQANPGIVINPVVMGAIAVYLVHDIVARPSREAARPSPAVGPVAAET